MSEGRGVEVGLPTLFCSRADDLKPMVKIFTQKNKISKTIDLLDKIVYYSIIN